MGEWRIRLRDWWRGYTNEDLASVMRKTEGKFERGQCIGMTFAEYKAWRALMASAAAQRDMEAGR